MSLLELLRAIGKRPAMFLAAPGRRPFSIWHLKSFLVGYECGRLDGQARDGDDILDSLTFWVCTRYNVPDGAMSWAGHLWRQSGEDDEAAFRLFFELLEDYVRERQQLGADTLKSRFMEMLEHHRMRA